MLRLEIVAVYRECGSIRETARRLSVSRNTVRKWVRRGERFGRRTPPESRRGCLS